MLWLLGDADEGAPNEQTIPKLKALAAAGKPYELKVFENADHGILLFEEKDGIRNYSAYAPGYFIAEVDYARRQSGLPPTGAQPGMLFLKTGL